MLVRRARESDLPAITGGLQGTFNLPPVTLVDLPAVGIGNMGNYAPMYLLLFHAGPSRYRRAYRAFLHAFDFGGDWETAWRDNILPLDGDRFRRDFARFLEREVKVVKRRR